MPLSFSIQEKKANATVERKIASVFKTKKTYNDSPCSLSQASMLMLGKVYTVWRNRVPRKQTDRNKETLGNRWRQGGKTKNRLERNIYIYIYI
jgi:hypothetical protein